MERLRVERCKLCGCEHPKVNVHNDEEKSTGFYICPVTASKVDLTATLPDSGDRTNFETGAVRDASSGKGMPHCIPPVAIRKLARRFEDGALKYEKHNWMKGIPLSRYQDAITRHTLQAAEGDTSEDHLGAVLWNAAAWAWTEEEINAGRLPADLDDLPYRKR